MKPLICGPLVLVLAACTSAVVPAAPEGTLASHVKSEGLDLVEIKRIENSSTAGSVVLRVLNTASRPMLLAVDIRAEPGMWLAPVRQETQLFYVPPNDERTVSLNYSFALVSPEAALRVRIGVPEEHGGGWVHVPEPIAVRSFDMGTTAAAASFLERFDMRQTPDLTIYALRGMFSPEELDELIALRTRAIAELSRVLAVRPPPGIQLVFYPDAESKTEDTHHIGAGLTRGNAVVEIFNDSIQLDPYHELAHAMAGQLGLPPAWLNEGFAVFSSEYLGADALEYLGSPGKTVDQASCDFYRSGELLPVAELMRLPDIGPAETRPNISYAQAASFTGFLVREFGWEAFRKAYRTLSQTAAEGENEQAFAHAFGMSSEDAAKLWLEDLVGICP